MESFFAKAKEYRNLENITSDNWLIFLFCFLLLLCIFGALVYAVVKREAIIDSIFRFLNGDII